MSLNRNNFAYQPEKDDEKCLLFVKEVFIGNSVDQIIDIAAEK